MFICEIGFFDWYFPQFCKSDMSKYGYLEGFRVSFDFEITRVNCSLVIFPVLLIFQPRISETTANSGLIFCYQKNYLRYQGPVVQSIVSVTNSLKG